MKPLVSWAAPPWRASRGACKGGRVQEDPPYRPRATMSGGTRTGTACCPRERCPLARRTAGRAERPWRRRGKWGTSACRTRKHDIVKRTFACRTRTRYIVIRTSPCGTRTHYIVVRTFACRTRTHYTAMGTSAYRKKKTHYIIMDTSTCRKKNCVTFWPQTCRTKHKLWTFQLPAESEHKLTTLRKQSAGQKHDL